MPLESGGQPVCFSHVDLLWDGREEKFIVIYTLLEVGEVLWCGGKITEGGLLNTEKMRYVFKPERA